MSPPKKKPKKQTGAISRLFSIGKMGLDVAKSEVEYQVQKTMDRSKTLERLNTQIKQMKVITETLGQMKGAVMKIGQMVSLYDIPGLPEEVRDILSQLQSQAAPIPYPEIKEIILKEHPDFFNTVKIEDEYPIAAASIGQVYLATHKRGEKLAIKVQVPEVEKMIRSDLKNLNVLSKVFSPWVTQAEMKAVFNEVKTHLLQECDYQLELDNLKWFHQKYNGKFSLVFPKAYPKISSKHVLTMSFVEGFDLLNFLKKNPSKKLRNEIAHNIAHFYFDQVFNHSIVHADPQFGNYLFTKDTIGILDFGCIKKFSPHFIHNLIVFSQACAALDYEKMEAGYLSLGLTTKRDTKRLSPVIHEFVRIAAETYRKERYQYGEYKIIYKIFKTLPSLFRQKRLHMPPDFILLERTLAGLYFLVEKLGANLAVKDLLKEYVITHQKASNEYLAPPK